MGRGTLGEFREESGNPRGRPARVKGPLGWSVDSSLENWLGPGRVGGHFGRLVTDWGTLREIRDGSGDNRGGSDGLADP